MQIKEKRHRLPVECYRGLVTVNFTFCIEKRIAAFRDGETVDANVVCLQRALARHKVKNWGYIFMPDHMHCILQGVDESSDLWQAAVKFKQLSGYWFPRHRPGVRWQKDFYDYVHRKEDDLNKHILYLVNNPVRSGLVEGWKDYPYKGSLDYVLDEIIEMW
jgi:putative transposase